ncbi:hypothetical protein [Microbacterium sp. LWH10-1.2]|uniref:hypothetical protein n=1 Tax=Microbacterium sp. LWH10-1.2 TaxID=3135255 RepID=UPI0031387E7F
MSEEPQPELRWAPIPPKPSRKGRVWLVIGLVVAALLIVGVLLFFLLPRGENPEPGSSASPSPSSSTTPTPSGSPTASPSPSSEPTAPIETVPPSTDPSIEAFRSKVDVWLDSAPNGLDIISRSSGQDALSVVDSMREDAQRLSDAQAPSSISAQWRDAVDSYAQKLSELRSAISADSGVSAAVDAARSAVQNLNSVLGA